MSDHGEVRAQELENFIRNTELGHDIAAWDELHAKVSELEAEVERLRTALDSCMAAAELDCGGTYASARTHLGLVWGHASKALGR